jgi:hypothetical protein
MMYAAFTRHALLRGVVALLLLGAQVAPAHAALQPGPLELSERFPKWYQDATPLRLELCLDEPECLAALPRPDRRSQFPENWPQEAYYWAARATVMTSGANRATLEMGTLAAFAGAQVRDGSQITLSRIRIMADGLTPNASYTVTHPYGVETLTADAAGALRFEETAGCTVAPCNFTSAMTGRLSPWLTWDRAVAPAPPAGFIGDFRTPHKVTGSPHGTNLFRIEGPNAGGPGTAIVETELFNVRGKHDGPTAIASLQGGAFNTAQSVTLLALDDSPTSSDAFVTYTTDGSAPISTSPRFTVGASGIGIPAVTSGTKTTTLKFRAFDIRGGDGTLEESPIYEERYVIDTAAPTAAIALSGTAAPATPGLYRSMVTASITGADDAAPEGTGLKILEYSLDGGATPTNWVAIASGGTVSVSAEGAHTLMVRATDVAGNVTTTPASTFTIDATAPAIMVDRAGGTYSAAQSVMLTASEPNVRLYYTTDGTEPTEASAQVSGPIAIPASLMLKVMAVDLAGNRSALAESYTIQPPAPAIVEPTPPPAPPLGDGGGEG